MDEPRHPESQVRLPVDRVWRRWLGWCALGAFVPLAGVILSGYLVWGAGTVDVWTFFSLVPLSLVPAAVGANLVWAWAHSHDASKRGWSEYILWDPLGPVSPVLLILVVLGLALILFLMGMTTPATRAIVAGVVTVGSAVWPALTMARLATARSARNQTRCIVIGLMVFAGTSVALWFVAFAAVQLRNASAMGSALTWLDSAEDYFSFSIAGQLAIASLAGWGTASVARRRFPFATGDRLADSSYCPQCWYSLEGIPSLKCPECGAIARQCERSPK